MAIRKILRRLMYLVLYSLAVTAVLVVALSAWYFSTLYTRGAAQKGNLALVGATVLVGEDLVPHRHATVLIRDGNIVQVGSGTDDDVAIPSDANTVDVSGYTLMPGLMDLHVHMGASELPASDKTGATQIPKLILDAMRFAPGKRRALLSHGVTTVRCVGSDYEWVMELRRILRNGELEGPRLFAAGPLFTTPGGHPVATLFKDSPDDIAGSVRLPGNADEARRAVRALADGDNRVDLIKVVQERGAPERPLEPIRPDVLQAIVAEAHQHGIPVFAHWGTLADLEEVLAADVDGLEHVGRVLEGWPDAILRSLVERGVSITPTLAVMTVKLPPPIMQKIRQRVVEFHAAGGRVVVGSDAGMPGVPFGPGVHRELELLVESGLRPQQALKAATSGAALVLRAPHIGAIAPGRAADLLVVDGNPLEQIQATRNVVMVFRDGRLVLDRRGEKRKR